MRTMLFFICFLASMPIVAGAQSLPEKALPPGTNAPPSAEPTLQKSLPPAIGQVTNMQDRGTSHVTYEGALVRATRAGQPWQAINPFAPAEFGQGYDNVSRDPHTRQPTGIILVSARFGGVGRQRR